jgi:LuxR family maltose regulon positive regulatory protein
VIAAPAGFGKTTLLSEWIPQSQYCVTWLSLDDGDNDPTRFWAYVVAALQRLRADLGESALALLQSPQLPPIKSILTTLINEIAAFPENFSIALDDYHLITTQPIHEALAFLLDHLPPHMRVILATRADPPLPLARLRASDQLTEIRADHLRFTPDEAAAFLNDVMGLKLSADNIAALETRTEGWVAGLQLAALSMQGRDDRASFIKAFAGSNAYIVGYLIEEVLQRQSKDVQAFLLQTSILERFTGPLCDAVTGGRNGHLLLETLRQRNLFVVPLDDQREWYRYHHLFAEVLQHRLRQEQPESLPTLHLRAAEWCEKDGLIVEAVQHALTGADYERAARLVEAAFDPLFARSEWHTLLRMIEALPEELVRSRPWLCLAEALPLIMLSRFDQVEARLADVERWAAGAEASASGVDDVRSALGGVAFVRSGIATVRGDPPQTIEFSRLALDLLPPDRRLWRIWRSTANQSLAFAYRWNGEIGPARQALAEAALALQADGDTFASFLDFYNLAHVDILEGHLHQAADRFRQALSLVTTRSGTELPNATMAHAGLGEVLYQQGDLENATHHLTLGLELAQDWRVVECLLASHLTLARIHQAHGDEEAVLAALRQAEQAALQHDILWQARVAAVRAQLMIAQGDHDTAARWAAAWAPDLRSSDSIPYLRQRDYLVLTRLLLAQGKPAEAARLSERLLRSAEAMGLSGHVIESLMLQALASQAHGDAAQAMIGLTRALALAETEGYIRLFVDEGSPMIKLLRQAESRHIAPAYVGKLLVALGDAAAAISASPMAQSLVEPLSVRELEVLRLLAAGLSTPEIAGKLVVTAGTVKNHLKSIYGKLDVHSRLQAVERARSLSLL